MLFLLGKIVSMYELNASQQKEVARYLFDLSKGFIIASFGVSVTTGAELGLVFFGAFAGIISLRIGIELMEDKI